MGVITSWHATTELIVCGFRSAAVHASLYDKLVITGAHCHKLAVLSHHNLTADSVRSEVLLIQVLGISGIKVTLLGFSLNGSLPLAHLFLHLILNFTLHALIFAANAGHAGGCTLTSAVLGVVRRHDLLIGFTINAVVSVVEHWARHGILEVVVSLRDVRLCNSPDKA